MLNPLYLIGCVSLVAASLHAQVVGQVQRSYLPQSFDVQRIVAVDLDSDLRDDAVLVLTSHTLVRAVNPGIASGFFPFSTLNDVVDAVGVRLDRQADLIVSVGPTSGLVVHRVQSDGNLQSVASSPAIWTDIVRLRVFDAGRFPLVAGIGGDCKLIRFGSLEPATYQAAASCHTHPAVDPKPSHHTRYQRPAPVGHECSPVITA